MKPFTYNALPARVIFGWGTSSQVADEVKRLGCVSLSAISFKCFYPDLTRRLRCAVPCFRPHDAAAGRSRREDPILAREPSPCLGQVLLWVVLTYHHLTGRARRRTLHECDHAHPDGGDQGRSGSCHGAQGRLLRTCFSPHALEFEPSAELFHCQISVGGGSTIGLGKALALHSPDDAKIKNIVIPTTCALRRR